MILFLHNRYRTTGGEERVVEQLLALVREHAGEPAELLERDSATLSRARAATGLLRGGLAPRDVFDAVQLTGARVVHAHNLNPAFGWRALQAAADAGAGVVLHLHQYRLVCANGVCYTRGADCTRCHARNTLPGVLLGCRGARAEGLAYGAALALWQRRAARLAGAALVPSRFALERLRELGAPLDFERVHVLPPPLAPAEPRPVGAGASGGASEHASDGASERAPARPSPAGGYALVVARLSAEKGVDVAIDACRIAGVPLVIAGEGPQEERLRARGQGAQVTFAGRVHEQRLRELRAGAALALVPSRAAETFGMAAAEAMAAGVPVAASRAGALPELVEEGGLVAPGDARALAEAIERRWKDRDAGERGRRRIAELCSPPALAERLQRIYDAACA